MSFYGVMRRVSAVTLQILVILIVINVGTTTYSSYYANRQANREEQGRTDAERKQAASEIAARCNVLLNGDETLRACLAREFYSYQEKATADDDLEAQQDMAFWTEAVFWLTAAGTIISGLGLIAVLQSLRHTRQAISTDKEIGHAQVRSYIGVVLPLPALIPEKDLCIDFKIRNTGQSPANNVAYIAGLEILSHPLSHDQGPIAGIHPGEPIPRMSISASGEIDGEARGEKILRAEFAKLRTDEDRRVYLIIRVFYDDVFKQRHETSVCAYAQFTPFPEPPKIEITKWKIEWVLSPVLNYST